MPAICLRAVVGARVSSEVARLDGLSASAPGPHYIQPSAPPLTTRDTEDQNLGQSTQRDSSPRPASASSARRGEATQSGSSGNEVTATDGSGLRQQYGQQHTAMVAPLAIPVDNTQPEQRSPVLSAAKTDSHTDPVPMHDAVTGAAAQMAIVNRWSEGSNDGQSDVGSYDNATDCQIPMALGPLQGYQLMVSNPLARDLHSGTQPHVLAISCTSLSTHVCCGRPLQRATKMCSTIDWV